MERASSTNSAGPADALPQGDMLATTAAPRHRHTGREWVFMVRILSVARIPPDYLKNK
jgi:hypothetical protein